MTDNLSKTQRSYCMSHVHGWGNKRTELVLVAVLRRGGVTGWRRHQPLFGRPDFVFRRQRVVVFVDGCFWHGCPLHGSLPTTNRAFWRRKLARNKARDQLVNRELRRSRWKVVRFWQHELADVGKCFLKLRKALDLR
jgi:DNA mismatch endonuclease (patch repair protein)